MAAQQSELPALSFPLLPKKGIIRASDQEKAFEVQPLDQLPGFLLASACQNLKINPPTLHLGWRIDDALLVRLCKERGIVPSHENLKEYLKDDGYVFNSDDGSEEEEDGKPGFVHKMEAFRRRCEELQLNVFPDLAPICDPSTKTMGYAVTVLSNYNFEDGELDRAEWPKIMREFGLEGQPKWYIDYVEWYWK
ncbi:hypothetical protein SCHPADRAFT_943981 [Schizopora paradoxa]|uniref:Uncharacterized protein n=1 Tax=Schizopora paradoxa TaxID=27342 RepID=A0A0H2RW54_9AGAM|nr:hypothetical protein SCHPADRAFT_943981 [Schizopora paradoxa]